MTKKVLKNIDEGVFSKEMIRPFQRIKSHRIDKRVFLPNDLKTENKVIGLWVLKKKTKSSKGSNLIFAKNSETKKIAIVKEVVKKDDINSTNQLSSRNNEQKNTINDDNDFKFDFAFHDDSREIHQNKNYNKILLTFHKQYIIIKSIPTLNIIKIYDAWEGKKKIYMFSEYISDGILFSKFLKSEKLDEHLIAYILKQFFSMLENFHYFNIFFVNLHPRNFIIDGNMKLKLINLDNAFIVLNEKNNDDLQELKEQDFMWSLLLFYSMVSGDLSFFEDDQKISYFKKKNLNLNFKTSDSVKDLLSILMNTDFFNNIDSILSHSFFNEFTSSYDFIYFNSKELDYVNSLPIDKIDKKIYDSLIVLIDSQNEEHLRNQLFTKAKTIEKIYYNVLNDFNNNKVSLRFKTFNSLNDVTNTSQSHKIKNSHNPVKMRNVESKVTLKKSSCTRKVSRMDSRFKTSFKPVKKKITSESVLNTKTSFDDVKVDDKKFDESFINPLNFMSEKNNKIKIVGSKIDSNENNELSVVNNNDSHHEKNIDPKDEINNLDELKNLIEFEKKLASLIKDFDQLQYKKKNEALIHISNYVMDREKKKKLMFIYKKNTDAIKKFKSKGEFLETSFLLSTDSILNQKSYDNDFTDEKLNLDAFHSNNKKSFSAESKSQPFDLHGKVKNLNKDSDELSNKNFSTSNLLIKYDDKKNKNDKYFNTNENIIVVNNRETLFDDFVDVLNLNDLCKTDDNYEKEKDHPSLIPNPRFSRFSISNVFNKNFSDNDSQKNTLNENSDFVNLKAETKKKDSFEINNVKSDQNPDNFDFFNSKNNTLQELSNILLFSCENNGLNNQCKMSNQNTSNSVGLNHNVPSDPNDLIDYEIKDSHNNKNYNYNNFYGSFNPSYLEKNAEDPNFSTLVVKKKKKTLMNFNFKHRNKEKLSSSSNHVKLCSDDLISNDLYIKPKVKVLKNLGIQNNVFEKNSIPSYNSENEFDFLSKNKNIDTKSDKKKRLDSKSAIKSTFSSLSNDKLSFHALNESKNKCFARLMSIFNTIQTNSKFSDSNIYLNDSYTIESTKDIYQIKNVIYKHLDLWKSDGLIKIFQKDDSEKDFYIILSRFIFEKKLKSLVRFEKKDDKSLIVLKKIKGSNVSFYSFSRLIDDLLQNN